jgi:hypothetical protein
VEDIEGYGIKDPPKLMRVTEGFGFFPACIEPTAGHRGGTKDNDSCQLNGARFLWFW